LADGSLKSGMSERCVISVDGMGGDHAPGIVVEGIEQVAKSRPGAAFLLHGDETSLKPLLARAPHAASRTTIRHTDRFVSMDAKPSQALRQGRGSSLWNAIEAVKNGEAVAAVSAGNTGALMAMSKLILRMVEGVHRPALVASWPTRNGMVAALDLGADVAADGMAKMIGDMLREALASSALSKAGALLAMSALKSFSARLDPRRVNGAVLMGLNGVVVKSHGGTDHIGFGQAVSVAVDMGGSRFKAEIEENLRRMVASARTGQAAAASEEAAP
jgi:fatty acid/phospholipid biosynthesis enzyme